MQRETLFFTPRRRQSYRALLAAVLIMLLLAASGCTAPPNAADPMETTAPSPRIPLTVTAGNETIQPYPIVRWSYFWDAQNKGWLAADGIPVWDQLPNIADTVPVITYSGDLSLQYGEGSTSGEIAVYNEAFVGLQIDHTLGEEVLHRFPKGIYYISISVKHQGSYIEEGKDYASSGYDCVFKMIVTE